MSAQRKHKAKKRSHAGSFLWLLILASILFAGIKAHAQQITTNPPAPPVLSGDCTTSGAAITCTKTGGVAFGTAATSALSSLLQAANNLSELTGSAASARTNLGLGSLATQAASAVAITGGTINSTSVGATTPASVKATTLSVSNVIADTSYSYQQPVNLFSITPAAGVGRLILDPAGTLAAGTVIMPASPVDGQILVITSSQIVTTLTLSANGGQSILGAVPAIALGGRIECQYRTASTTWFC